MGCLRVYRDPAYPYYQVNRCEQQSHAERKHIHADLAVALVTGGASKFYFNEMAYRIRRGQLVMIGPGFVHRCCPESADQWSFFMVFIDPAWLDLAGLPAPERPCFVVKDLDPKCYGDLLAQFESLCRAGEGKDEILLSILDQALSEAQPSTVSLEGVQVTDAAVSRVCEHIRQHLAEPLRLDDLAELAGMDKYMLIRSFGKAFNTTPHAWQLMHRMNEARRLLACGHAIAETSLMMGFYDQSHFSRLFKQSFGITPKQFTGHTGEKTNGRR